MKARASFHIQRGLLIDDSLPFLDTRRRQAVGARRPSGLEYPVI